MIFELIVFDKPDQASEFNARNTCADKYAVSVGQGICGLHRGGQRPNKLTRKHSPLTSDYQRRWEREVLLPAMDFRGGSETLDMIFSAVDACNAEKEELDAKHRKYLEIFRNEQLEAEYQDYTSKWRAGERE